MDKKFIIFLLGFTLVFLVSFGNYNDVLAESESIVPEWIKETVAF